MHEVDDSTLEFPDDDDDVISGFDDEEDDFDFFDASEGLQREPTGHTHKVTRKMKSSMTHSMYGPNSMAEFQSMFYSANAPQASADGAALSRSAEKLRTDAGFFLRLFVDELLVSF